ncbi:MAG: hypothetical protein KDB53_00335 [Planctomycetes bacterium]|nr:hypothetical protein [Planctomycetota bacterium]
MSGHALPRQNLRQIVVRRFEVQSWGAQGIALRLRLEDHAEVLTDGAQKARFFAGLDRDEGAAIEAAVTQLRGASVPARPVVAAHFGFRYLSAGALPRIPAIGSGRRNTLLLFHRDIAPLGWNLANGASGSAAELKDPLTLMRREAAEEIMAFDPDARRLLTLERSGCHDELDLSATRWMQRLELRESPARFPGTTWGSGPDRLIVGEAVFDGLHLSIQAEDASIEIVRTLDIPWQPHWVPLDGELHGDALLDRPIAFVDAETGVAARAWRAGQEIAPPAETRFCPVVEATRHLSF